MKKIVVVVIVLLSFIVFYSIVCELYVGMGNM